MLAFMTRTSSVAGKAMRWPFAIGHAQGRASAANIGASGAPPPFPGRAIPGCRRTCYLRTTATVPTFTPPMQGRR
ncbi:hypothetical protein GCM10027431_19950 [Lysobacter rhizosphaerae]